MTDSNIVKWQPHDTATKSESDQILAKYFPSLSRFALMLSHPEFASFFDEFFKDWEQCQQSIMLLKTGAYLRDTMKESTGQDVSGNELLGAMIKCVNNGDSRRYMVESLQKFVNTSTSSLEE
jgi:hypothetical protein